MHMLMKLEKGLFFLILKTLRCAVFSFTDELEHGKFFFTDVFLFVTNQISSFSIK